MRPRVWGPQTGAARFLMPERELCPPSGLKKTPTCAFSGKISPEQMVTAALDMLAERKVRAGATTRAKSD
jgi:hypothetical protein